MRKGNGHNYLNIPLPPELKYGGKDTGKKAYGEPKPMLIARVKRGVGNLGVVVADALRAKGWQLRAGRKTGWIFIYGTPPMGESDD